MEMVADGLRSIRLPSLKRPSVKPTEAPTAELIEWATKLYAYSVIAHVRTVLGALVQLAQAENIPASRIIGRHVFEWAAHSCYMSRNLKNYVQRKEWGRAWSVLTIAGIGNLWARQHRAKYALPTAAPLPVGVPDPLSVANLISAYESYQSQQFRIRAVKDNYSLLCDFSHPNSAC
jgi:hypothetical protein